MTNIRIAENLFSNGAPTQGPRYVHDCEDCVFLGQEFSPSASQKDVWFCPGEKTLIIRTSSEGADYASFPLDLAPIVAEKGGPGSDWSEAVSRYDDWTGYNQQAVLWEYTLPEEDDGYETMVGLYQDLKVRTSEKGNIFFRDQNNGALGVALPVNDDSWEFRPHEDMDALGEAFARARIITGRKALTMYVLTLAQMLTDTGH